MPHPAPLPHHLGRTFSTADARASGVATHRLRARDLASPFHGVRTRDVPDSLHDRCLAYAAWAGASVAFSHATAAALWELPLPRRLERDDRLHVVHSAGGRAPRSAGVVGHTSARSPAVASRHGLRLTDPVQTWLLLAPQLTESELVAMGDGLLHPAHPHTDLDTLAERTAAWRGARGIRRADAALALVRPGSASPRETHVRLTLSRAGLPEPELGGPIRTANGRIYHGDLVFREARVVVEYEGDHHRTDAAQWRHDLRRYNALTSAGWRVVRIAHAMPDAEIITAVTRLMSR